MRNDAIDNINTMLTGTASMIELVLLGGACFLVVGTMFVLYAEIFDSLNNKGE